MTDGHPRPQGPWGTAVGTRERPVLPTGVLRRTSRLAVLPLRHAGRTAAAASRLSRAATDQVAARTAEQLFATLGELKGGAAKLGQAMSVFEAAMPEEVAAPYRSALRRLTDAAPAMPAELPAGLSRLTSPVPTGPVGRSGWWHSTTHRSRGLDRPGAPRAMAERRGPDRRGGGESAVPGCGPGAAIGPAAGPAAGAGDRPAHPAERVRTGRRARQPDR